MQKYLRCRLLSLWLLPWLLLDPACQIYGMDGGRLLVRIAHLGTAGVLHLDVHKIKTATF
jgi:hypothetical protein